MLESLRKHTGGWIAKIFIALLVLSFAVWGVADIFTGYRSQALVTVDETEISVEEFRFALQREMQEASRQLGRSLSLDQARALGIDRQVLGRLVAEATLDNDARAKGLGISDQAVARAITRDPAFHDSFGNFSRIYFDQVLRSAGLSEEGFVARQREAQLRQQIAGALTMNVDPPRTLVEAVHRFTEERREIAYVVLDADDLESIPEPTQTELNEFFEANKEQFGAPEYRDIEIITATPAALLQSITVPEEDITATFELHRDSYAAAEKREVQQIVFTTEAEAKAAAEKIAGGADFLEVAKERGLSERDISLGLIEESAIIDPAVRAAAFSLEEGEVSDPIKGRLGTILVRVTKIEPAEEKPVQQIREEIRRELAEEQARNKVLDMFDAVEDERATGAPFREIAELLRLPYRRIEAVDAQGRDASGEPIDLPLKQELLRTAFETDPGVELDALQTDEGGFVWLNVLDVTPERDRTLAEVRDEVEEAWRAEQQQERLAARAEELLKRLKGGTELRTIAQELGTVVTTTQPLKRTDSDNELSQPAIETAFATPEGGIASSLHANGTDRVLMKVESVAVPAFDPSSETGQRLARGIEASLGNSLLNDYVAAKQDRFGISINQQSLEAMFGEI